MKRRRRDERPPLQRAWSAVKGPWFVPSPEKQRLCPVVAMRARERKWWRNPAVMVPSAVAIAAAILGAAIPLVFFGGDQTVPTVRVSTPVKTIVGDTITVSGENLGLITELYLRTGLDPAIQVSFVKVSDSSLVVTIHSGVDQGSYLLEWQQEGDNEPTSTGKEIIVCPAPSPTSPPPIADLPRPTPIPTSTPPLPTVPSPVNEASPTPPASIDLSGRWVSGDVLIEFTTVNPLTREYQFKQYIASEDIIFGRQERVVGEGSANLNGGMLEIKYSMEPKDAGKPKELKIVGSMEDALGIGTSPLFIPCDGNLNFASFIFPLNHS